MAKYVYPAFFTPEENGMYSVSFPDLEGCYTSAESLPDALEMAEDALALMLYDHEMSGKAVPVASDLSVIETDGNVFVNYISCDTSVYQEGIIK